MLTKSQFFALIKNFDFNTLFNELGWDHDKNSPLPLTIDEQPYRLTRIVQKCGFAVLQCVTENLPHHNQRKKSSTKPEIDTNKITDKTIEIEYSAPQEPKLLWKKLNPLAFKLEEENQITLFDVTNRIQENFKPNCVSPAFPHVDMQVMIECDVSEFMQAIRDKRVVCTARKYSINDDGVGGGNDPTNTDGEEDEECCEHHAAIQEAAARVVSLFL